jgi:YVTN family beta-propeller protein
VGARRFVWAAVIILSLAASACWVVVRSEAAQSPGSTAKLRRPVAVALLVDGQTACIANSRSGTVSVVDLFNGQVCDEVDVGKSLADVVVLPDGKRLLAVDEAAGELITVAADGPRWTVTGRRPVGPSPVSVAVTADGTRATVARLWPRCVEVVDLAAPAGTTSLHEAHTVRLPFSPRVQCALPGGPLVVAADAFGSRLAVVDAAVGRLVAAHELPGHNIRGLAVSADGRDLLVSHQLLDERAPATVENLQSGDLLANVVRRIPIARLTTPGAELDDADSLTRLGGWGAGAGDPAGVIDLGGGRVAVALAGVHEVALLGAAGEAPRRVAVGRGPTAVAAAPGGRLVVVNTFDDSLSVIDPDRAEVTRTISLGPMPELGPKDRGEQLFFDARLSRDGWLSCHSCHTDGHTNGLLADTLGDGTYGTPKRTLTLLGTRLTDPWGWAGKARYLHDQVAQSLDQTMHAPAVTPGQVGDLTTFLASLPPPPPVEPETADAADRARLERGRRVFEERGCVRCHVGPLTYSTHELRDVGFADEKGLRRFNPPSLRGVGHGVRFLHDGRAAALEEMFSRFKHQVGDGIEDGEVADLVRFLRSL